MKYLKYYYFVWKRFQIGQRGVLYYGKQSFCERPNNIYNAWTVEAHGYQSSGGAYRLKKILKAQAPESDIRVVRVRVIKED